MGRLPIVRDIRGRRRHQRAAVSVGIAARFDLPLCGGAVFGLSDARRAIGIVVRRAGMRVVCAPMSDAFIHTHN